MARYFPDCCGGVGFYPGVSSDALQVGSAFFHFFLFQHCTEQRYEYLLLISKKNSSGLIKLSSINKV